MKKAKKGLITGMPKSEKIENFSGKDLQDRASTPNMVSKAESTAVQKKRIPR